MTRRFDALKWAASYLRAHIRDENIGEILLEARLNLSRTTLLANLREPLTAEDADWLKARIIEHVQTGKPVQYMLGTAPFYGRDFRVTPDVLIPRQETEELVWRAGEWAARYFGKKQPRRVCDIGTGSGAIAVTLALEHPAWKVAAVDLSEKALAVAKDNAAQLGASVAFYQGSFLEPLRGKKFDMLISNPPYITREEMTDLADTVRDFEPRLALCGGEDGLDPYRAILSELPALFGDSAIFLLAFEIGAGQGSAVAAMIRRTFGDCLEELAVAKDLSGLDRNVLVALRIK